MEKAPAFQFYPKDFIVDIDVQTMTPEQRGGYIMLLAYAWLQDEQGTLPNDDETLARLSGLNDRWKEAGQAIKSKFELQNGRLINPRLIKEKIKQQERRQKCSKAGKISAENKQQKLNEQLTNVQQTFNMGTIDVQQNTNSSSSSSSSSSKDVKKHIVEYLNKKTDKKYKQTNQKTNKLIQARINDGFKLEEFLKVIDIKTKEWLNTDMEKYLRPETLFGTKFESYLNQKIREPTSKTGHDNIPWITGEKHYTEDG